MLAAYIEGFGGPDVIRYGELPDPEPGPRQVLVRTEAVAVDAVDTYVRSGAWATPVTFPLVLGRDLAGTVAAAGADVTEFAPGDRVWTNSAGYGGRPGATAELAVVAQERLYRLPDGAEPVPFVAAVHPGATAHGVLIRRARLRPGETVAVAGANGAVGMCLVQVAAAAGASVIAVARGHGQEHPPQQAFVVRSQATQEIHSLTAFVAFFDRPVGGAGADFDFRHGLSGGRGGDGAGDLRTLGKHRVDAGHRAVGDRDRRRGFSILAAAVVLRDVVLTLRRLEGDVVLTGRDFGNLVLAVACTFPTFDDHFIRHRFSAYPDPFEWDRRRPFCFHHAEDEVRFGRRRRQREKRRGEQRRERGDQDESVMAMPQSATSICGKLKVTTRPFTN